MVSAAARALFSLNAQCGTMLAFWKKGFTFNGPTWSSGPWRGSHNMISKYLTTNTQWWSKIFYSNKITKLVYLWTNNGLPNTHESYQSLVIYNKQSCFPPEFTGLQVRKSIFNSNILHCAANSCYVTKTPNIVCVQMNKKMEQTCPKCYTMCIFPNLLLYGCPYRISL